MFSGVGFEDAQKVDVLDQLTVRPSCVRIAVDEVIRSGAEAHVINVGA